MAAIRMNEFSKSFGGKPIHQGVSFSVSQGECLGLIGGSGAGKSVLLRSLIGLEKPDQGQIYIGDQEISHWTEDQLVSVRKKVAYVFQNGALFDSMTVYDNLAYPLREHTSLSESQINDRIQSLLKEFGLSGQDQLFPAELSGGMQKRVGLARAIILEPEVILYDEPTAGLDPFNTRKIQEMILRLKKRGVTSIFVSHDMPSAFVVCDRIALLKHGRIEAVAQISDLKKEKETVFHKFIEGRGQ